MKDKPYTVEQEQIARFAKAMGHPERMAILAFLANQENLHFYPHNVIVKENPTKRSLTHGY